jgi:hypothetical protein
MLVSRKLYSSFGRETRSRKPPSGLPSCPGIGGAAARSLHSAHKAGVLQLLPSSRPGYGSKVTQVSALVYSALKPSPG